MLSSFSSRKASEPGRVKKLMFVPFMAISVHMGYISSSLSTVFIPRHFIIIESILTYTTVVCVFFCFNRTKTLQIFTSTSAVFIEKGLCVSKGPLKIYAPWGAWREAHYKWRTGTQNHFDKLVRTNGLPAFCKSNMIHCGNPYVTNNLAITSSAYESRVKNTTDQPPFGKSRHCQGLDQKGVDQTNRAT